jgi:hypothetical protein
MACVNQVEGGLVNESIITYLVNCSIPSASQGPTIWLPVLGWVPINSPLVGSFLGVLGGFAGAYIIQYIKYTQDRKHYRKAISDEIGQCITDLKAQKRAIEEDLPAHYREGFFPNEQLRKIALFGIGAGKALEAFLSNHKTVLLPTDRWTSTISSGGLRFFTTNEADKLSIAYQYIQEYNLKAQQTQEREVTLRVDSLKVNRFDSYNPTLKEWLIYLKQSKK